MWKYSFNLNFTGRQFELACRTLKEMESWVRIFELIAKMKDQQVDFEKTNPFEFEQMYGKIVNTVVENYKQELAEQLQDRKRPIDGQPIPDFREELIANNELDFRDELIAENNEELATPRMQQIDSGNENHGPVLSESLVDQKYETEPFKIKQPQSPLKNMRQSIHKPTNQESVLSHVQKRVEL